MKAASLSLVVLLYVWIRGRWLAWLLANRVEITERVGAGRWHRRIGARHWLHATAELLLLHQLLLLLLLFEELGVLVDKPNRCTPDDDTAETEDYRYAQAVPFARERCAAHAGLFADRDVLFEIFWIHVELDVRNAGRPGAGARNPEDGEYG